MTILTDKGIPARPELEQALKRIDDGLSLRFLFGAWQVCLRWPQSDKRWQAVHESRQDPEFAFDIVAALPKDCPPDQAASYVEKQCKHLAVQGREDVQRMLDRIHAHNAQQQQANMQSALEYAEELIDANKHGMAEEMGIHMVKPVFQSESLANKSPGKTKRTKGRDL